MGFRPRLRVRGWRCAAANPQAGKPGSAPMSRLHRRVIALTLTIAVVTVAVVLAAQRDTPRTWTFRVKLGAGDAQPTSWSGTATVDGGEVVQLAGWRFEGDDKVNGTAGW